MGCWECPAENQARTPVNPMNLTDNAGVGNSKNYPQVVKPAVLLFSLPEREET